MHKNGVLAKAQPLWAKCCRVRMQLENARAQLRDCNDTAWLFSFAKRCRRQGTDFDKQLRLLIDGLETTKEELEKKFEEIWSQLKENNPSLLQASHSLAGARLLHSYEAVAIVSRPSTDSAVKRRGIVARCAHLDSLALCRRFDFEYLPLPKGWKKDFPNATSWVTAYRNDTCRNRIHKMISKDKQLLRLP